MERHQYKVRLFPLHLTSVTQPRAFKIGFLFQDDGFLHIVRAQKDDLIYKSSLDYLTPNHK